jgi:Aspartyl/Asparaginyl beta-hydroxylase
MLDLPELPVIDKQRLIGGCARLPVRFDAARLQQEIGGLAESCWGTTAGRVGVHRRADAIFLRGFAPAEGNKPIEDREVFTQLPYAQFIIRELIPAQAFRCLIARLPAGASIAPHIDQAPYFAKTVRLHFPIKTHDAAWMTAASLTYRMQAGEVWALNNSGPHAVWNADPTRSRTHMICDFEPSTALIELLARSERHLGARIEHVDRYLAQLQAPARAQ